MSDEIYSDQHMREMTINEMTKHTARVLFAEENSSRMEIGLKQRSVKTSSFNGNGYIYIYILWFNNDVRQNWFRTKRKKHVYVKPSVRRCTYSVSQLASVATISHLMSSVSRSTVKNVISNMGLFLGFPDTCRT